MDMSPTDRVHDRPLWHRPQLQRLVVPQATNVIKILKEGSTEDFFTHALDWPRGVLDPRR